MEIATERYSKSVTQPRFQSLQTAQRIVSCWPLTERRRLPARDARMLPPIERVEAGQLQRLVGRHAATSRRLASLPPGERQVEGANLLRRRCIVLGIRDPELQ